jgi:hypothetical protein
VFVIIVQLLDLSNFFFNAAAGYILGYRSVLVVLVGSYSIILTLFLIPLPNQMNSAS